MGRVKATCSDDKKIEERGAAVGLEAVMSALG